MPTTKNATSAARHEGEDIHAASVGSWRGAAPFAARRVLILPVTRAVLAALAALLDQRPRRRVPQTFPMDLPGDVDGLLGACGS